MRRIGLITQLLWPRYGPFWAKLLHEAGHEVIKAEPQALAVALSDARLAEIPGLAFRYAAAQALAMSDCDFLLTPGLNPKESQRGGGQDPWIADFPSTLQKALIGLPAVLAVPATLEEPLESLAVGLLHRLSHDTTLVRRAWERHRASAKPPHHHEPHIPPHPNQRTLGLLAQPWLLSPALGACLQREGVVVISQGELSPALLRAEGRRVDPRLIDTDAEVIGAARYLGRKGSIDELVLVVDETSGTDRWLASRVARLAHKPLTRLSLQSLIEEGSGKPLTDIA
ncbi:MAG: hypothetical protein KGZ60_12685 [Truepera sp.]|nr:hypothetical protein [Truepera sp.]